MATDREFHEMVARCVSIMVSYHGAGRTRQTTAEMVREVHAIAREVMGLGHRAEEVIERVLRPTEAELLARYGHEAGVRFHAAFLDAFEEEADLRIDGRGSPHRTLLKPTPVVSTALK